MGVKTHTQKKNEVDLKIVIKKKVKITTRFSLKLKNFIY